MEDNFYKTSTERLIAPTEEQQQKELKERTSFERERPLITDVMARLEKDIAARERIDSITETKDPEAFMREIAVNKQVCSILKRELNALKVKVRKFDNKKPR